MKSFAAEEVEDDAGDNLMSFASTYNGTLLDNQKLRAAAIYNTGSNVHVVNRRMEHRIKSRRPAQFGLGLIVGGHFYPVGEIVHAVIYPAVKASYKVVEQNTEDYRIADSKKDKLEGENASFSKTEPPGFHDCDTCIKAKAHALVSRRSETHRK